MWSEVGQRAALHEMKPRSALERRRAQGNRKRDVTREDPGPVCPWGSTEAPMQRAPAVPASRCLAEELSEAMLRLDMGLESEYACEIFSSLLKPPHHRFRGSDMPRAITGEMRALVIDWLVQVHEYLHLADDTLYLGTYLMNSYMTASRVRASYLQLLGAACLFLACKVEEAACPEPVQLCFMMEDAFSPKELLRMERKVLACLKFELYYANPIHLLRLLAEVGHCSLEVQYLAVYFLELSLMEADCLAFEPAQVSLATLCLAQRVLQEAGHRHLGAFQEGVLKVPSLSESELSAVFSPLARAALRGPRAALQATFLKYAQPQKLCISTSPAIAASGYLRSFLGSPEP
uniref:Cyclin P n=1 Tax=Salvator merianae TaxID=96440 RepID=A0A8D0BAM7_SALMN